MRNNEEQCLQYYNKVHHVRSGLKLLGGGGGRVPPPPPPFLRQCRLFMPTIYMIVWINHHALAENTTMEHAGMHIVNTGRTNIESEDSLVYTWRACSGLSHADMYIAD